MQYGAWAGPTSVHSVRKPVVRKNNLRPPLHLLRSENSRDALLHLFLHPRKLLIDQGWIRRGLLTDLLHLHIPLVRQSGKLLLLGGSEVHLLLEARIAERTESLVLPVELIVPLAKSWIGKRRIQRPVIVSIESRFERLKLLLTPGSAKIGLHALQPLQVIVPRILVRTAQSV